MAPACRALCCAVSTNHAVMSVLGCEGARPPLQSLRRDTAALSVLSSMGQCVGKQTEKVSHILLCPCVCRYKLLMVESRRGRSQVCCLHCCLCILRAQSVGGFLAPGRCVAWCLLARACPFLVFRLTRSWVSNRSSGLAVVLGCLEWAGSSAGSQGYFACRVVFREGVYTNLG